MPSTSASAPEPRPRPARSRVRVRVLALTLSLIAIAYLDRVCIATAAPVIRFQLGLDAEQMGFVFSAFTFSYALFEVPSGWLADRFGPRTALTRIVTAWSVFTAATGLATGFGSLLAVRLLFGIGEAGAFPSVARVYSRWLPPAERGRAFGLTIATGAIAGAATMKLVVMILGIFTWRQTFALFGAVGIVWVAAWRALFRDDPRDHPGVSDAELREIGGVAPGDAAHTPVPWRRLARNRSLVMLCVMYAGAIYGWYFFLTWLPTYLKEARGFDLRTAGSLSSLPLLGIATGVWLGGLASDRLARTRGARARRIPGMVALPFAAVCTLAAAHTASPTGAVVLLSLAAGLGAAGVAPAWAVCLEIAGEHAGVVTGAMNTFGNLGGTLCPVVIGATVKRLGSWQLGLASVAAFYAVAAVAWIFVDPTREVVAGPRAATP